MTTRSLKLAKNLSLPLDAVTQTFAIFGKRGSGKTNGATVLVEELLRAHLPVVVLDPVDAWWGLKSSFDGKKPGLPVYVFGGAHQDLPLESTAGALIADVVAKERLPLVLSMKLWTVAERARFVADFAKRLLQVNADPVMMVLEEADAFIPQRPAKGEEAMLGAMDRLVRWGRQSGVGCTIVTQRSAKVNKDVTTQAETLIAFRTTGPQDREAIDGWIKYHAGEEQRDEVLSTLPTLPNGTAWVWSPEWLHAFGRYGFRRRETYDSAATPKVGEKRPKPKHLATVDLDRLRDQMAETVERAKADDPRELRRQIAELKKHMESTPKTHRIPPAPKVVEKFVLKDGQLARAEKLIEKTVTTIAGFHDRLQRTVEAAELKTDAPLTQLRAIVDGLSGAIAKTRTPEIPANNLSRTVPRPRNPQPANELTKHHRPGSRPAPPGDAAEDPRLATAKGLKKHVVGILTALAQHPQGLTREQTLIYAGYQPSGDISTAFAGLLERGWIDDAGGRFRIADAGLQALGPVDPLPTGEALRAHLLNTSKLSSAERKMLAALFAVYPEPASRAALHERAGLKPSGDTSTALGKFRKLGWVRELGDGLVAAESFFE